MNTINVGALAPRRALAIVAGLAAASVLLAACSGSNGSAKSSSPSSPSTVPPSSAATSAASGTSSAGGDSPDVAAIKSVYSKFIDPSIPVAQKSDLIQDGTEFADAMLAQSKSPSAQTVSIQVAAVTVDSASKATVTYSLLLAGSPVLTNQKGYAVHENGTWKVAGYTFCGLLAAQGPIPPVCSKPAATTLPG